MGSELETMSVAIEFATDFTVNVNSGNTSGRGRKEESPLGQKITVADVRVVQTQSVPENERFQCLLLVAGVARNTFKGMEIGGEENTAVEGNKEWNRSIKMEINPDTKN